MGVTSLGIVLLGVISLCIILRGTQK